MVGLVEVDRCETPVDSPNTRIELSDLSWPSYCRLKPQPEACHRHYRRFQEVFAGNREANPYHSLDLRFQIHHVLSSLSRFQSLFETLGHSPGTAPGSACWCLEAAIGLHEHTRGRGLFTWETAAEYLEHRSIIANDERHLGVAQYFAFCLTGALTCLYVAASPISSSSAFDWRQYSIETSCDSTSHRFWCFFTDSNETSIHHPVGDFLAALGDVLPLTDENGKTTVEESCLLDPRQVNAEVLTKALKMEIRWTDILGAHLDFDGVTNTLFLFRQPTLCLLNAVEDSEGHTILQSCVIDSIVDEEKLKNLMQEVLLSLYVIYGQCSGSRRAFCESEAFSGVPDTKPDPLLQEICGGRWNFRNFRYRPKRVYKIGDSFPILGAKLAFLAKHAHSQEPRSIGQLWKDKRNTLQWWTFWAVIVLGVVGLTLSAAQTVLAAMQMHYATQSPVNGGR